MDKQSLIQYLRQSRATVTDETALIGKELFPVWNAGIEITQAMIDAGENRYQYNDKLYKAIQPHITQADWAPDTAPSLFTVIDVEHEGTETDPIPYSINMIVYNGKYYSYEGTLYKCIRDSGIALQYTPDQLIDNYFVVV